MTQKCADTLAIWHRIVAEHDPAQLPRIFHADAVFRSPFAYKPYKGRDAVVFILSNVTEVFEDFTYHRELIDTDGRNAFLEFTARVGDKTIKGIDLIAFDENGLITEFEVMIRPMSALMALAEQMAPRIARLEQGADL